ncbi:hypothetical protein [Vibrio sonorensis]|uniref:hypothetical protein n=1 Tax=Vibrio sonorensis TaxID=1004316 RepID=UPI0008DA4ADB|nr:hypothetical protein [Vibrio sonorensis]
MISTKENQYCSECADTKQHIVVLVRKSAGFEGEQHQSIKQFITAMIKSWSFGAFLSSMDDFERHIICETCGAKRVEE